MKIYKVGGAVRDELLGFEPRDLDFLVINSSPAEMKKLGFIQVGSSYEVFLHPESKDEYVLAPDLMQDLNRRDLTINSMAQDEEGNLIDPFDGQNDLRNKILKHTSSHFADDPLRVYRLARFKAQYPDFSIAQETLALCKSIIQTDEFQKMNGERILAELKSALVAKRPELFFSTLDEFGANLPGIRDWTGLEEVSTRHGDPLYVFAYLVRNNSRSEIELLSDRLLIQNDWREAGLVISKIYHLLPAFMNLQPLDFVNLFYEIDAFRKPYQFQLIEAFFAEKGKILSSYFSVTNEVTIKDVDAGLKGKEIGDAIKEVRIKRLVEFIKA